MAMSDYGFIAKKNGILLDSDKYGFMDMKTAVGCEIEEIKGNYFAYLGDKDFFVTIYKNGLHVFENGEEITWFCGAEDKETFLLPYECKAHNKCVSRFNTNNANIYIKKVGDCQYLLKMFYKNDFYNCVYGYGVGYRVFKWWKKALGLNKKKSSLALKWLKYI
jgi:hypothetical protein